MSLRMREGVEVEVLGPMTGDAVADTPTEAAVTHHVRAALHSAGKPDPKATDTEHQEQVSPAVAAAREEKAPQIPLNKITGVSEELAA